MRRYIWIVVLLLCCGDFYGQGKVSKKDMERAAEVNKGVIIDSLKRRHVSLESQYGRLREQLRRLESSSFNPTLSDEQLAEYLGAKSLEEIYSRREEVRNLLASAEEDSKWAPVYEKILDIRQRLEQPYNKKENERDMQTVAGIRPLGPHEREFQYLCNAVNNYRFIMFELARVIKMVNGMVGSDTRISAEEVEDKLREGNELETILEVPYAQKAIETYIKYKTSLSLPDADKMLGDLVGELQGACPEAFE